MGITGGALRFLFTATLLAGCGKVGDTTPADAGPDADLSGDANVVTQSALFGTAFGAKIASIDLVSMLPNNQVLATGQTDANGAATIKVYPGGSVTAIYKHTVDLGADLITFAGVKPGDTLTFGNRQPSTSGQTSNVLGTVNYSWPALGGTSFFEVFSSCTGTSVGSAATTFAGPESSLCHKEPMDALFGAFNASGVLTSFGFRSNVAFSDGVAIALGGWSPAQTGAIAISGLPIEVNSVSGAFRTILDSNNEISMTGGYNGTPTGGAFSASFPWHPTGERTVGQLFLNRPGFSGLRVYDSFSSNTLTQTVASPTLPPWPQGGVISSSALRQASWFLVPDATSVSDGQMLRVSWSHTISGTSHPSQWFFILPPPETMGDQSIDFPALPAPLASVLPVAEDSMGASIRVFDISTVTGYDAVRALPSATPMCLECAVRTGDIQRVVFGP
jgi:hypothetical protein